MNPERQRPVFNPATLTRTDWRRASEAVSVGQCQRLCRSSEGGVEVSQPTRRASRERPICQSRNLVRSMSEQRNNQTDVSGEPLCVG